MNGDNIDNDIESLINDGDLQLDAVAAEEPVQNATQPPAAKQDMSLFAKIPVKVTLEVASVELSLQELMDVDATSVIMLDKLAGEPLDMKVNGALFAKAEVVVINGNYGLRIVELCGNGFSSLTV